MAMVCPKCGREATGQEQTCIWCGTQLQPASPVQYQQQYPQQPYQQQPYQQQYPGQQPYQQQQYQQQPYQQQPYQQQPYQQQPYGQPNDQQFRKSRQPAGYSSEPVKNKSGLKKWLVIGGVVLAVAVIVLLIVLLTGGNKNNGGPGASNISNISNTSNTSTTSTGPDTSSIRYSAPSSSTKVGDLVSFGTYEQDNNPNNGPEPITWSVLEIKDGKAMLISKYGLDAIRFNTRADYDIQWENCSLRAWLNGAFLNSSFTDAERSAIALTEVDNGNDQHPRALNWNNTQDYVYILSYDEAFNVYFLNDAVRRCAPTDFAIANGASLGMDQVDGRAAGRWWLRSGYSELKYYAYFVKSSGGYEIDSSDSGNTVVRPVLWVNLQ